ncbi:MAG: hypothetical protein NWE78_05725 [Candidatus Bathyarchaeota archaeon]|nr:hypothetical protein [Candidatus Bathyarchaeota archaeon]
MSEEASGLIRVLRSGFMRNINETLFITPDRVIVARTSAGKGGFLFGGLGAGIETAYTMSKAEKKTKELLEISPDSILTADKNNYAIPSSEITRIDLWKKLGGIRIRIETSDKRTPKWVGMGTHPKTSPKKGFKIGDYENILRPVFGEKLFVKK